MCRRPLNACGSDVHWPPKWAHTHPHISTDTHAHKWMFPCENNDVHSHTATAKVHFTTWHILRWSCKQRRTDGCTLHTLKQITQAFSYRRPSYICDVLSVSVCQRICLHMSGSQSTQIRCKSMSESRWCLELTQGESEGRKRGQRSAIASLSLGPSWERMWTQKLLTLSNSCVCVFCPVQDSYLLVASNPPCLLMHK